MTQIQDWEAGSLIIGEGVRLNGKIDAPGTVLVNGAVDGDVAAQDIRIGVSGRVNGSLTAQNIDLAGQAGQTIAAVKHLVIRAGAIVTGNIKYQSIEIEAGARIEGTLESNDRVERPKPQGILRSAVS
ncbi:MAG: polymer-forming cytoskeletal protein [Rhodocyclaceae bacterium]|nr:MAG: polymer-forming cytoskeletal protein [Rhodocyclaceae bacterium]